MKIYKNIGFFLHLVGTLYPAIIFGQDAGISETGTLRSDVIEEKIVIAADRTIYTVDDCILFKAVYLNDRNSGSIQWSTVLYVELITADGNPVVQSKFPLTAEGTSGAIQIPIDLNSGMYYLKAYTKWMRNYPAGNYGYYQIKLINPYKETLLTTNNGNDGSRIESVTEIPQDNHIEITTDKLKYGTREKVEVGLILNDKTGLFSTYIISVVKKKSKNLSTIISRWKSGESTFDPSVRYYPEINGIALSGKVVNSSNSQPVSNANMSLSLLNTPSFFSEMITNSNGEFFFTFPYSEKSHEFYLNAEKDNLNLEISIDKDFCNSPVKGEGAAFTLSDEERNIAREMAVNTQITEKYKKYRLKEDSILEHKTPVSFYGSPDKVIFTQDYIDLPTVEEFLFEIVPEITVSYQNKVPHIHTSKWNVYQDFPFLILIDNIPVSGLKTFLDLKPNTIERIELINNSYVIGDSKYNGILAAYSKNQNIAGIDLPKNSQFFNYTMYSPSKSDEYLQIQNFRIPDRRNCLYWNPDPDLSDLKSFDLSFYTSDNTGEFDIVVQRISKIDGKVSFSVAEFTVE